MNTHVKVPDGHYISLDKDGHIVFVPLANTKKLSLPYVIVRCNSAGVFAGYLESRKGDEVVMKKARRLWYWDGAASLSQLAMEGVSKPQNCKFPCEVEAVTLLGVIEILDTTEKARACIESVPFWSA